MQAKKNHDETKKKFILICNEIAEHCACYNKYCFFREIVMHQNPSLRMLIQFDAMEKWKYEESERLGYDIGENAAMQWVEQGFAEAFADVYDEDLTVKQIYTRTINRQKELKSNE